MPRAEQRGPMWRATEETLGALKLPPSDTGLAALVRLYAAQIDEAEQREARFDRVLERISRQDDPDLYEALSIARGLLSARNTIDRLGGRYHSGMAELRATPRSRPMPAPRAPTGSPLGRLRLAAGTAVDGDSDSGVS